MHEIYTQILIYSNWKQNARAERRWPTKRQGMTGAKENDIQSQNKKKLEIEKEQNQFN